MRTYLNKKENELASVVCNCCKKELLVKNGILKEECISVSHDFGFFSERDGETQEFDLCETCYNKIVARFQIPAQSKERGEKRDQNHGGRITDKLLYRCYHKERF